MTITEMLDEKLGNATPSTTIAEALGYPDMPINEALDMYESAELTPKEEPEPTPEPVVTKYTVSYNANGGEGTIESVEVVAGESITLDDGSGLTPPENKTFLGWAKSASAQSATVESPFTPDKNTELFAVYGDL